MKVCACGKCHDNTTINDVKALDEFFPKGDNRRGEALVLCAEAFLLGKSVNSQQKNLKSLERANQRLCKARNVQPTSNGSKTDISLDANSGSSADNNYGTIFNNKKGCGKQLGDKEFPFYCGKECDLCHDCHIHYCKDCGINYESAESHGNTKREGKE